VVANLPADLVPLWHRVKRSLRCRTPDHCAELLVEYAHEHPTEAVRAMGDEAESKLADLLERRAIQNEQRAARSGNGHFAAWLAEQDAAFDRRHKLRPLASGRKKRESSPMAKTKTRSHSRAMVRASSPKPIVIRTTVVKKPKKTHHRRGGGMNLGGFLSQRRTQMGIAGAALGLIDKSGMAANLPKLPWLGEHGTIAVAAYFLSDGGRNQIADNICTGAIFLAGYELAKEGHIDGDAFGF